MTFVSSLELAQNDRAAQKYVAKRPGDAQRLLRDMYDLGYVTVTKVAGGIQVGDVLCHGVICALAYILARWW